MDLSAAILDDVQLQLESLSLRSAHPLLIVDVDEVLVGLAAHLGEFAAERGYLLKLTSYKLDGALKRANGDIATDEEFRTLFKAFFELETVRQRAYPGAAGALEALSRDAQIVILTNVPASARACRIENLRGHGIPYPLVVNSGPKGGPVAWLAGRVEAPVAFIDDSPSQIASVAELAPEVTRLHFVGDDHLRGLLGPLDDAHYAPGSWAEIHTVLATDWLNG